jgi:hypothetical protein
VLGNIRKKIFVNFLNILSSFQFSLRVPVTQYLDHSAIKEIEDRLQTGEHRTHRAFMINERQKIKETKREKAAATSNVNKMKPEPLTGCCACALFVPNNGKYTLEQYELDNYPKTACVAILVRVTIEAAHGSNDAEFFVGVVYFQHTFAR